MSNVQFEGDGYRTQQGSGYKKPDSILTRMAMSLGAKDAAQAQMVLLGVAVLAVVLTGFVAFKYLGIGRSASKTPIMPANMQMMQPNAQR